jgi:hypothetical protein
MNFEIGDKLKCLKTINNLLQMPLFIENNIYEVLDVDEDNIILNHIMYGNEYGHFNIKLISENFKKE